MGIFDLKREIGVALTQAVDRKEHKAVQSHTNDGLAEQSVDLGPCTAESLQLQV